MTKNRLVDLSEHGAYLHVKNKHLILEAHNVEMTQITLDEIAAVCLTHPAIRISRSALSCLAENGAVVIVANEKHLPVGMFVPLTGNFVQAKRFSQQAALSLPTKKQLWKRLVQAKIRAQSNLIKELHGDDEGLSQYVSQVRSGDSTNVEAVAARKYWGLLFRNLTFARQRDGDWPNSALNYGYAVLRAISARAICSAGLHPSLGIHHKNQFNSFCLADDIMEPYRVLVDRAVFIAVRDGSIGNQLNKEAKKFLLEGLTARLSYKKEKRTLFDLLGMTANSLQKTISGSSRKWDIALPDGCG